MNSTSKSRAMPDQSGHGGSERKVRLNVELNAETSSTLTALAERLGTTKSEFLRKAINLMEVAVEEKQKGNSIAIADKDAQRILCRIVGV